MAQFKINLLTSVIDTNNTTNAVRYLETPISEFYEQSEVSLSKANEWNNRKYNYCYTFDETVSFHENGQKELSFSMIQKIWLDNELTINPFTTRIKNGSQILLIDQYDNEYIFTVKDVKISLTADNMKYTYSCQDAFTYQHIRQHSGYSIENDATSEDFIGANTVDWWAFYKIKKDCHIAYDYIPLSWGVYLTHNKQMKKFKPGDQLNDVLKIIKPPYLQEDYPELYEKISFAVSGSNASAALISLAEEVGLNLNYREHHKYDENGLKNNLFCRYFWFEPKKSNKPANLKYSPRVNIQSFDLSHGGSALTTVLNVESNEFDDELVSLIPDVPPFFSGLFISDSWESSHYNEGYFTKICQNETFFCEGGNSLDGSFEYNIVDIKDTYEQGASFYDKDYLYIHLRNCKDIPENSSTDTQQFALKLPLYYPKVSLFNDEKETSLFINNRFYSAKNNKIEFGFYFQDDVNNQSFFTAYNDTYSLLSADLLGKTQFDCYLRIKITSQLTTRPVIKDSKVLLCFSREVTEEELNFAEMADLCPWLENKLIDFSYFLNQGVISASEYKFLLNTFKNDLRIINGKLLYYSKEYYRSIQSKTEQLARITNTLDSLGAAFNSDIIEAYKTTGKIDDISYFREAYRTYQTTLTKATTKSKILNYEELLSEYFNKYFQAQQRFLKNIYYFKQYFNQKVQWNQDVKTSKKTLTFGTIGDFGFEQDEKGNTIPKKYAGEIIEKINNDTYIRRYLSFGGKPYFKIINDNFKGYTQFLEPNSKIFLEDKITEAVVVDMTNYQNYYIQPLQGKTYARCDNLSGYNANQTYYRVSYKGRLSKDYPIQVWDKDITDTTGRHWYQHHYDNENVWYCSAKPDAVWGTTEQPWPENITWNYTSTTDSSQNASFILEKEYIAISYKKIINEYLYKTLYKNNSIGWQYYDDNTNQSTDNWFHPNSIEDKLKYFSPAIFGNSFSSKDWDNVSFKKLVDYFKGVIVKIDDNEVDDEIVNFYKAHFPITSVIYNGPNYINAPYEWNNKTYDYQRANKNNETYTDYVKFLIDKEVHKKTNLKTIENPFTAKEYVSRSIPIVTAETENKYFKRVPKGGAVAASSASVLLSGLWTLAFTGAAGIALSAIQAWAHSQALWYADTKWAQSGVNTKDFEGRKFTSNINYTGYHDYDKIIYTNSASSYDDWLAINKQRAYNQKEVVDVTISTATSLNGWKDTEKSFVGKDGSTYHLYEKVVEYKNQDSVPFDYFDYYSKIALTYSSACNFSSTRSSLQYKDSYLRRIVPGEVINKNSIYKVLMLTDLNGNNILFKNSDYSFKDLETNGRISRILYYFIDNNCSEIDLSEIEDNVITTWDEYLPSSCTYNIETEVYQYIDKNNNNKKLTFILFQQEDFNRRLLYQRSHWNEDSTILQEAYRYSLYKNNHIYNENDIELIFDKASDLVEGLYIIPGETSNLELAKDHTIIWEPLLTSSGEEDSATTTKFWQDGKGLNRVYTIPQMKNLLKFYYIDNEFYEENTLNTVYDFSVKVFLHQEKYVKTKNKATGEYVWNLDKTNGDTFVKEAHYNMKFRDENNNPISSLSVVFEDLDGFKYSRNCSLSAEDGSPIGDITNGHFWYLYHSQHNLPLLFETAAVIETELTQYWQQAYSASMYCEYFLPQHWQPQSDGDVNYFNNNIITYTKKDNNEIVPVLSNLYLPDVAIYNNGITSRLPKYELKYGVNYINNESSNDEVAQTISASQKTRAAEIISTHPSFVSAFNALDEDMQNYIIDNYNNNENNMVKTTYYYVKNSSTGTKWKNFLSRHSSLSYIFDDYDGLYLMTYKILKKQFEDKGSSNYQVWKSKQDMLWDSIHIKYPGVLLEDYYSNEYATSSYELYSLARNSFRDKQEPERGYNISLINAYNSLLINTKNNTTYNKWTPYLGQELKIGESILIDAEEYYDNPDDVYKSLSQYLFISDISYSLRKNSDIQVTVNTIKYQDKLIQRLVKLIK